MTTASLVVNMLVIVAAALALNVMALRSLLRTQDTTKAHPPFPRCIRLNELLQAYFCSVIATVAFGIVIWQVRSPEIQQSARVALLLVLGLLACCNWLIFFHTVANLISSHTGTESYDIRPVFFDVLRMSIKLALSPAIGALAMVALPIGVLAITATLLTNFLANLTDRVAHTSAEAVMQASLDKAGAGIQRVVGELPSSVTVVEGHIADEDDRRSCLV